jgi:hypothetical protein
VILNERRAGNRGNASDPFKNTVVAVRKRPARPSVFANGAGWGFGRPPRLPPALNAAPFDGSPAGTEKRYESLRGSRTSCPRVEQPDAAVVERRKIVRTRSAFVLSDEEPFVPGDVAERHRASHPQPLALTDDFGHAPMIWAREPVWLGLSL